MERFVVDDGWFGARRDDTAGLGDWQISQDVWPDGDKSLKALADYVHAKGMEFGLWFEPEMVNPDSDVARNHPDWILSPTTGRLPLQGRTQQVLDLTNPDAFDYIYGCMDQLVGELGIDYIEVGPQQARHRARFPPLRPPGRARADPCRLQHLQGPQDRTSGP